MLCEVCGLGSVAEVCSACRQLGAALGRISGWEKAQFASAEHLAVLAWLAESEVELRPELVEGRWAQVPGNEEGATWDE